MENIKTVIVGDGAVGKTALIIAYTTGSFPADYIPTVADKFQKNVMDTNGKYYSLSLWDTAGQEGYAKLRSLSYPDTNVFIICFSVDSQISFDNVRDEWLPELKEHAPQVPILLVGTKADLRSSKQCPISEEMGKAMSFNQQLAGYLECSAKENRGLEEIFKEVVNLHVKKLAEEAEARKPKKRCTLL